MAARYTLDYTRVYLRSAVLSDFNALSSVDILFFYKARKIIHLVWTVENINLKNALVYLVFGFEVVQRAAISHFPWQNIKYHT